LITEEIFPRFGCLFCVPWRISHTYWRHQL
jgi:hypothetical protein